MKGVCWTTCPKCRGRGHYRPRHSDRVSRCPLCQGMQQIPATFAERTGSPRREGMHGACDDCGEVGTLLPVELPDVTLYLCARHWTREVQPELLAPVPEPALQIPF